MSSPAASAIPALPAATSKRSIAACVTLLFTAPLVAEYLLGDLPIKLLPALIVLAPMYGGGALLIREVVRRIRRGWPSILLLGAAYALLEEAYTTQSLFNPDYLHLHGHFLTHAWIPSLHIGGWWTLFMINLHAFWSISVSIALVEGFFPSRRDQPWLGRLGDSIVFVLFLVGCAMSIGITLKQDRWIAPPSQFIAAGVVILALIVLALRLRPAQRSRQAGTVPSPWITGTFACVLGFLVLIDPPTWNWGAVAAMFAIDLIFLVFVFAMSRRAAWSSLHIFSLAAGGAVAYGVHAFIGHPVVPGSMLAARMSNGIFLAAAIVVIFAGARRTARSVLTADTTETVTN
ncbi:MAG TPA: hypothetical protein VHZ25_18510 [Acidobacteriaceae bacterium]|jgi:hypothetical protein|nr:hypothetical protein [Acidobacteriaceae bacterium]